MPHEQTAALVRRSSRLIVEDVATRNLLKKSGSHRRGLKHSILEQQRATFVGLLKPQPMRTLAEIRADILALEHEIEGLLEEIVGKVSS